MSRVLIQAGHSDKFTPFYGSGGGAPGEAEWTGDLATAISVLLETASIETVIVGHWMVSGIAWPPPPEASQDYDLFVALHYDASVYAERGDVNSGCFAGRAASDPQFLASDRAIKCWESIYLEATGIPLRADRINPNVTNYYAFHSTSAATPGILIEHGCGSPVPSGQYPAGDDAPILHDNMALVAECDAHAIMAFLGVPYYDCDSESEKEMQDKINELTSTNSALADQVNALREEVRHLREDVIPTLSLSIGQPAVDDLVARLTKIEELATLPAPPAAPPTQPS